MTTTTPAQAYLLRMEIAGLLNNGADFDVITGIISRRSKMDSHVRNHLLSEATFFHEHGQDLGLVFVIDVGDGPFWSKTLRAHVKVVEGAPMFQCSGLQASPAYDEVATYHLVRGYLSSMMSSNDYSVTKCIDWVQGLKLISDMQKIGIIAEILYYHKNSDNALWALDAGDNTDFFDTARLARVDVTTNLHQKRCLLDTSGNEHLVRPDFIFAELQLKDGFHPRLTRADVLLNKQISDRNVTFREIAASRLAMNWPISHGLLFGQSGELYDNKFCAIPVMGMIMCDELRYCFPQHFQLGNLNEESFHSDFQVDEEYGEAIFSFAARNIRRRSILAIDLLEHLNDVVVRNRSKTKPLGNIFSEYAIWKVEDDSMVPTATGLVLLDSIHAEHLHYPAEVVS
tara:strand:+ start:739 stop:1935 length:1197 start_codon:yes stop_codon:yes gene_type:complete